MPIITAAIIAGGGALLGGGISALGASSAANSASQANINNTNATNAANLALFNYGRGGINPSTGFGNAVLPQYFGGNEQAAANQAYQQFQNLSNANSYITPQLQQYLSRLSPSVDASLNTIGGQFNGQNLHSQLGFAAPVYGANTGLAQTTGQGLQNVAGANTNAINSGLAATIAQLNASNQANGFFGNSSFNNNRMAAATIGAQQQAAVGRAQAQAQAAQLMAQAHLQNTQNTQGLQSANLQGMMNTGLIPQGLSAAAGSLNLPNTNASNNILTAQQPLSMFRLQPQSFQLAPLPYQQPAINGAQALGGAVSAGAGAYGNSVYTQQLMSMLTQPQNPYANAFGGGYGGAPSYNPSLNLSAYGMGGSPYSPISSGGGGFNTNIMQQPINMSGIGTF